MAKRYARHPWDKWFKKRKFRLVRGPDFQGMPHAMSVQVRSAALDRDIQVSVTIEGDTLTVTRRD